MFVDREHPDMIFGAKKGSPLVIGMSKEEKFVSSDYRSLIGLIDHYMILEDGDIFTITPENYSIANRGLSVERTAHVMDENEKKIEL